MGDVNQKTPAQRTDLSHWLAGLPCLVAAVVVAVAFAVSWGDLPDPMAVQFGGDGDVNRVTSPWEILAISQLMLLFMAVGATRAAVLGTMSLRSVYIGSSTIGVFLGYLFTVLVLVNSEAAVAREARMPMWHFGVAVGLTVAVGVAVRVLSANGGRTRPGRPVSVGLRAGEKAVWIRAVGPRWLMVTGLLGMVAALVWGALGSSTGFWLAPLGLLTALFTGAQVSVDARGLTVRHSLVRVPRKHVPLERIERAWAQEVRPLSDLGGWGYRVSTDRSGVALRSGQGLWLRLTDGKEFVVAVDDAVTAAGLLNDLVARHRTDGA
ncbi:DUF1648 domain-containing protein [Streptomyces sp. NPDC050619]|uniref:DUF1648 domain-containing protein n=1 Tax=Streptomyces sp. NPDC050619 TaxID=3157214 RepID=UPI003441B2C0